MQLEEEAPAGGSGAASATDVVATFREEGARGITFEFEDMSIKKVEEGSQAANPAFDVTPRDYVSGIITERGVCEASETALLNLYPEKDTKKQQNNQG